MSRTSPAACLPSPLCSPEGTNASEMPIKAPFSRINGATSLKPSQRSSGVPAVLAATTVERSEWTIGNDDDAEYLQYERYSSVEDAKTGETLTSLELDLEGDCENSTTSDLDSGRESSPTFPHHHHHPAPRSKKKKRNKLRQLSSNTEHSAQYPYDSDADVDMLDTRMTAFHPSNKPTFLDVSFTGGEIVAEEGSSPKTILPGNALQLHLDDDRVLQNDPLVVTPVTSPATTNSPSSPVQHREHKSASSSTSDDQRPVTPAETLSLDDGPNTTLITASHPQAFQKDKPPARVHFRSRVRITSGFHSSHNHHRHRHEGSSPRPEYSRHRSADDLATSTTTSGSPSSSISAPIRYQPDENNILGPLGKRLSSLAESRRRRHGVHAQSRIGYMGRDNGNWDVNERTPFLRAGTGPGGASVPSYTRQRRRRHNGQIDGGEEDEDLVSGLKREEDVTFGKWPWRVFNRHWWWYHLEPILCCCSDDLDDE